MPRRKANLSEVTLRKESEWVIVRDVFPFDMSIFLDIAKEQMVSLKIIPEEAKTIRMIFENFLNGSSMDDIKQCLESTGRLGNCSPQKI